MISGRVDQRNDIIHDFRLCIDGRGLLLHRDELLFCQDALHLLEGIRGIGVTRFTDTDVVRHPLVAEIIRAYDARDRARSERMHGEDRFAPRSGPGGEPGREPGAGGAAEPAAAVE